MPGGSAAGRMALAGAMIAAPFIALAFRAEAGLAVMAAALMATVFLLRDVHEATAPSTRRWIRMAIVVDLTLAVACLVFVVFLVARG